MRLRRLDAALTASLALLAADVASAQPSAAALVGPLDPRPAWPAGARDAPDFRMPDGDLREPGVPRRSGLIAAFPVRKNLDIAVGRFAVPRIARPRTHMESDRQPTAVRARDRGIAAVGISLRF